MTDFQNRRRIMVDTQVRPSDVTEFPIIDAMLSIPRECFVPKDKIEAAYIGEHVEIGAGRHMLDPRIFAKLLEALNLTNQDLVLDVGAGLGYSSAVIARIAEAVVSVEADETLSTEAVSLLSEQHADNVVSHQGRLAQGAAAHGPYDAIILQGAIEQVPEALLQQLKEGGRIAAIFLEDALGTAKIGHKLDGKITWRAVFNGTAPLLDGFEKITEFAL
ncbi:MAG: protein-L-isoaspartate O-methyltransferase [Pelagimonas sp.]|jgi:protein-L-isoaspartate(D-aspartate) O-methyltransferase|nr:protein-L-isoaspartate O-methyltransferase [Pelagimonas sp.]